MIGGRKPPEGDSVGVRPSIHYRRRWFYVLWCVLLLASIAGLALWEVPARIGNARIILWLQVKGVPARSKVMVWVGPHRRWPGSVWQGQGAVAETWAEDETVSLKAFRLPVAYRRWVKDCIPRRTADLVVIRFEAPGQPPRYRALSLGDDWQSGLLAPGRMMHIEIKCEWNGLGTDPSGFSKME